MIGYLSINEIIRINDSMITQFGGTTGIRDLNMLESSAVRPRLAFGGEDMFPTIFDKAAALGTSIIKNHPFVDGNKRTGINASFLFLYKNGFEVIADNEEVENISMQIASSQIDLHQFSTWLKTNSNTR